MTRTEISSSLAFPPCCFRSATVAGAYDCSTITEYRQFGAGSGMRSAVLRGRHSDMLKTTQLSAHCIGGGRIASRAGRKGGCEHSVVLVALITSAIVGGRADKDRSPFKRERERVFFR